MQQQKLCLKWNNHTLNLLSVLETFQQKDILVDVTLSCEGHNIKAHKMVLSACSPYFQNIFLENPCQHPIVIINGMKYEDITAILNFMYKGEVNVSHDSLSSFLQAAEALKVKGLAEVCGEKKSPGSGIQEPEQNEQTRPQRTETPTTKRRQRNRKRSLSDSNRSDDEAAPRKHKGLNSPEVHELSGDESYTGDMSSNGQNSRVPQNVYSRSHQSSSNITADEMDDEYEVEPSKMLEQTLTTDNANSASSDNSLRIERIMGNATEMESSSLHEPESPPDIKPIIEYGESSAGPSEGSMMVYNEQSQPGPSSMQDGSLLHDNSHTQGNSKKRKNIEIPPVVINVENLAAEIREKRLRRKPERYSDIVNSEATDKSSKTNSSIPVPNTPSPKEDASSLEENIPSKKQDTPSQKEDAIDKISSKEFEDMVLEKLNEVIKRVNILELKMDLLLKTSGDTPISSLDEDFAKYFPLKTYQKLGKFEEYISTEENLKKVVTYLVRIGGTTEYHVVVNILRRVLSNNVAEMYSWWGAKGKKVFKSLTLVKGIIAATRVHFPEITEESINVIIQNWLRHAKIRRQREEWKGKETPKENEDILRDGDES